MAITVKTLEEIRQTSKERENALNQLSKMKDEDIDYSDIPPLIEEDWKRAMTYEQFLVHLRAKNNAELMY